MTHYASRNFVVERVSGRRSVRWIDFADTIEQARRIMAASKPIPGTTIQISSYHTGKVVERSTPS